MSEEAYEYDNFRSITPKVVDGVYLVRHGITYKLEVPIDKMRFTKRINVLTGEVYYPSNADRIRAMTDEELAEFMKPYDSGCPRWNGKEPMPCSMRTNCRDCWLDWLKSPVEVEE